MKFKHPIQTLGLYLGLSGTLLLQGCYSTVRDAVILPLRIGAAIAPSYQSGTTEENVRAAIENSNTPSRFEDYKRTEGNKEDGISDILHGQALLLHRE